jgi:hypothetical protein
VNHARKGHLFEEVTFATKELWPHVEEIHVVSIIIRQQKARLAAHWILFFASVLKRAGASTLSCWSIAYPADAGFIRSSVISLSNPGDLLLGSKATVTQTLPKLGD